MQYCSTNWPSGADYGNPLVHDIMKLYLPTLEACIVACASYNENYQSNLARGISMDGGLCRAVSIVKTAGEYCYLKNGTGSVSFAYGKPEMYSSAKLVNLVE